MLLTTDISDTLTAKSHKRKRADWQKRSYTLPPKLVERLEQEATSKGRDRNSIIISALTRYFEAAEEGDK